MRKFSSINESIEPSKELEMGIKIESEHCDIYDELEKWMKKTYQDYASMPWSKETFYKKIAEAHIKEMPDYYTRLSNMENEG
jgi:hypothetical protein